MKTSGKSRKKQILKRIVWVLIVLLLLAAGGGLAYSSIRQKYTVTYDTYTATTGSISNALSFSGNLSLIDSATYTASSSGSVKTLYVAPGEDVQEGDRLVRMNNGETVTAGFAGRVNRVDVSEGEEVTAGTELIQIADFKRMQVSFRIDEYDISDVSVGQECTVTVTALEKQFKSTVSDIDYISSSSGNVAYYTATAYVTVDDDAVLPGMQATVSITKEESNDAVILKVDAVSFDATNQAFVYMKNDAGELEEVSITTGVSNGNYIEITEGLSDGDEVYAEAQTDESSTTSLLGALFGRQTFNQPQSGRTRNTGNTQGNMPGFDGNSGARSGFGSDNRPGGGN